MNFADFKYRFSISKPYTQLIYINIAVFVAVALMNVFRDLFGLATDGFADKIQLPSSFGIFAQQFWSLGSYMFLHINLLHLFFNMICLYWFGQLFLMSFTNKQLIGLYLLGGILGGLLYMVSYSYLSFFEGKTALLSGASASIMALITAAALETPNMPIRLLFIGQIKLKWIAIATILLSILGITSSNAGGAIAHIGGAFAGWLWFVLLQKNINITKPINAFISFFANIFRRKPKIKNKRQNRKYHYVKSDEQYNIERKENNDNLDMILDKIRQSGYGSLTEDEKKRLFDLSQKV